MTDLALEVLHRGDEYAAFRVNAGFLRLTHLLGTLEEEEDPMEDDFSEDESAEDGSTEVDSTQESDDSTDEDYQSGKEIEQSTINKMRIRSSGKKRPRKRRRGLKEEEEWTKGVIDRRVSSRD